jgi:peroxiredoxin
MRKTTLFYIFLLSGALLLGLFKPLVWGHQEVFGAMGIVPPRTVKPAPDFTLESINGDKVGLGKFRGKPVLLHFWATWCEPCREELPTIQRLYESLKGKGIEVVAISIDRGNVDKVQKFVDDYHLTFPILLDPSQKVRRNYYILGLPTSYLIDSKGKLRGYVSGPRVWDSLASQQAMLSLLE